MSAPEQGRQSPDPERSTGAQTGTTAENPNEQGAAPSDTHAQEASKDQLNKLESNPKGPLEDAAETKTAKGTSSDK